MTIYQDLIEAGIQVSNWQSDLYFPRNAITLSIKAKHPDLCYSFFNSNIDGTPMIEAAFAFDPFWDKD